MREIVQICLFVCLFVEQSVQAGCKTWLLSMSTLGCNYCVGILTLTAICLQPLSIPTAVRSQCSICIYWHKKLCQHTNFMISFTKMWGSLLTSQEKWGEILKTYYWHERPDWESQLFHLPRCILLICVHGLCSVVSVMTGFINCFQPQQNVRTVFPHMPKKQCIIF